MAKKETFEDQVGAVSRLFQANRSKLPPGDAKHVGCAIRNLEQLARVRQLVVDQIGGDDPEAAAERMSEELIKLLHLPTSVVRSDDRSTETC